MQTILTPSTREALIDRIQQLSEESTPQWGSMTVYQMAKHCAMAEEMFLGKTFYPRVFLGRIFGRVALQGMIRDDKPFTRNARTSEAFVVSGNGELAPVKDAWIQLIREYSSYENPFIVHWFFGKMTKEEIGRFTYKHIDHHLRQFNV